MSEREAAEAMAHLKAEVVRAVMPIVEALDRLLRRWPWLYRRLGG